MDALSLAVDLIDDYPTAAVATAKYEYEGPDESQA